MIDWQAVVLAAGRSTRFSWPGPKLLYPINGVPMIVRVQATLAKCGLPSIFVLGHRAEEIRAVLESEAVNGSRLQFAHQGSPLGTGHALMASRHLWSARCILVQNGDMPLVRPETILAFCKSFAKSGAAIGFSTARVSDPTGYGRVLGHTIVEERDCSPEQRLTNLVNAGIYAVDRDFLVKFGHRLDNQNKSGEFYLTDLPKLALEEGLGVFTFEIDAIHARGINTLEEAEIAKSELVKVGKSDIF